ncbi:MAG: gamma-glutamyl-gamma-aminobutyrate hydrolase family protein [Planctomycetes bacterium]|nr:gamma-glutamyl-gamma-aminobutyrate hydrolase family protein [Planctomycetota bacterium]
MNERPVIGVTCSLDEKDAKVRRAYIDAVTRCGGAAVLLPAPSDESHADAAARACLSAIDAVLFTGGDDPATERYGVPTHPAATVVSPARQRFEEALLAALDTRRNVPVLGICLGMQMMALHAGGALDQNLPESLDTALEHQKDHRHEVRPEPGASGVLRLPERGAPVASWHHQGVKHAGGLRVVARAHDGLIEGVDDPARPFYLGVQWHPERTGEAEPAGDAVIRGLVEAARRAMTRG